jgi:hypothetical protein
VVKPSIQSPQPGCSHRMIENGSRADLLSSELSIQLPYRRLVKLKGLAALRLYSLQRGIRPAH